jgi:hypothetical protein
MTRQGGAAGDRSDLGVDGVAFGDQLRHPFERRVVHVA